MVRDRARVHSRDSDDTFIPRIAAHPYAGVLRAGMERHPWQVECPSDVESLGIHHPHRRSVRDRPGPCIQHAQGHPRGQTGQRAVPSLCPLLGGKQARRGPAAFGRALRKRPGGHVGAPAGRRTRAAGCSDVPAGEGASAVQARGDRGGWAQGDEQVLGQLAGPQWPGPCDLPHALRAPVGRGAAAARLPQLPPVPQGRAGARPHEGLRDARRLGAHTGRQGARDRARYCRRRALRHQCRGPWLWRAKDLVPDLQWGGIHFRQVFGRLHTGCLSPPRHSSAAEDP
mmetsp:Transcript_3564/g.7189  ORF Transcript_3564/g.7189 Transcript_3564/m.7189 type:complete len:285 (+) Transcript_3564:1018-1872(+)